MFILVIPGKRQGLYEVRATIQRSDTPYTLMYALVDHTSPDDVIYGEEIRMESDSVTEVESLQEFDVLDKIQNTVSILGLSHFQNITLKMRVRTNSVQAVGFMMHVQPMGSIGRYRILLGSLL